MELDPQLAGLAARLAELGARGTVSGIQARITTSKSSKQDRHTIETLEEIVDELISERTEILRIAQAFEEELVAERISDEDIGFITNQFAPKMEQLLDLAGSDANPDEIRKMIEVLVSRETVKVLQVLGFNFRDAVGRPLTDLVARFISARGPVEPNSSANTQQLLLESQISLAKLALDQAAYDRFLSLIGQ